MFGGFAVCIVVSAGLAVFIPIKQEASDDAGHIEKLLTVSNARPTTIWSADRVPKLLYRVAAIERKVIDLTDPKYPSYIRYALVAAEDRRFYDHQGVDYIGLARAAYRHGSAGGGSTISMQLAKNLVNGDDRNIRRKLKDIATAQEIENLKPKDDILNLYANSSYFGEHAYGIERASEIYFGKPAEKLTVGEAAMLARCVRLPGRVNPVKTPQKMLGLRDYVLGVMRDEGWINQGQYDEGVQETPKIVHGGSKGQRFVAPDAEYFVQHVLSQLHDDLGVDLNEGGYTIQTTLNYALQRKATKAVADTLAEYRGDHVNDGAVVVMDAQGRILAEVGGPKGRQFNVVTQGLGRQPGSAFKAIVYATALKNGYLHPGDMLSNARIRLPLDRRGRKWWTPENSSAKENAPSYSLETAFALSVNRPAIWTIIQPGVKEGPRNVAAAAHDVFGIQSHLDAVPSLALGSSGVKPLEMLAAYSVFMLNGDRATPLPILKVTDPGGEDAHPYSPIVHHDVLDPKFAGEMDEIMKGPVQYGTATYARVVPNARGKTGTTNDHKDAWFCGYSDGLVGVAWTGNTSKKGLPLQMGRSVFGGTVPVKIWTAVMLAAHNLGLAKGVKATPETSVTAAEATEESRPRHPHDDSADDAPRPDPDAKTPPPEGPVTVDPAPDATPASPPPDPVEPPQTDLPKSDPPASPTPVDPPPLEKPRRADRPKRAEPKREAETVEVEVCVDTGLRASMYCPETVTRSFPKGRAPRKLCTLHHG